MQHFSQTKICTVCSIAYQIVTSISCFMQGYLTCSYNRNWHAENAQSCSRHDCQPTKNPRHPCARHSHQVTSAKHLVPMTNMCALIHSKSRGLDLLGFCISIYTRSKYSHNCLLVVPYLLSHDVGLLLAAFYFVAPLQAQIITMITVRLCHLFEAQF